MPPTKLLILTFFASSVLAKKTSPFFELSDKIHAATTRVSAPMARSENHDGAFVNKTCANKLRPYGDDDDNDGKKRFGLSFPQKDASFQFDLRFEEHPHLFYDFKAKAVLKNYGNETADDVTVKFYASPDQNFDPDVRAQGFIGKTRVRRVKAQEVREFEFPRALATWGSGARYIISSWQLERCSGNTISNSNNDEDQQVDDNENGASWTVIGRIDIKPRNTCKI
uniref:Uncharacterized protein n=1 Tax=Lotharella oceanica TaxID=641309 RepID=A0A7S2TET8_9EUKA|mmetsp:Transcript_10862/g.20767  ORF Transcript_10862/g.20767 Transcript_10862/m.20767 type:complete len:225 (+) Transcript_10862:215-889(+)|eukprot:CAMPEP_0170183838 /NCGR_PEP_ID=MMETSP0040_2-20121228/31910_1 /TAXON_ID=641309 /ORGANISM="Lotharella oceanica, Strain CCMP622" /LENGTH=224 /DNA_ID=CAMNT_0010429695 /DNA_START=185 /DNA_END=859 /DNA_ORIENTATION=-